MSECTRLYVRRAEPSPDWLFSFGMPKCGTTSLCGLFALSPALALHAAKEPNDFIIEVPDDLPRYSGYSVTEKTRYLVDFSTQYGMPPHRGQVLDKLAALGLLDRARFIVSLRPPDALARSYFEHLTTRSGLNASSNVEEIRSQIKGATDFSTALDMLTARVSPKQVFVVKLEDLVGIEAQRRTAAALSTWLGISPIVPVSAVKRNTAAEARRYSAPIEALARRLRR